MSVTPDWDTGVYFYKVKCLQDPPGVKTTPGKDYSRTNCISVYNHEESFNTNDRHPIVRVTCELRYSTRVKKWYEIKLISVWEVRVGWSVVPSFRFELVTTPREGEPIVSSDFSTG